MDERPSQGSALLLRRGLLLLLALFLAWQVISLQMANHFARSADLGQGEAAATALWWDASQPRALELEARRILADADEQTLSQLAPQAERLLQQAVAAEPARGNNLALLALINQQADDDYYFAGIYSTQVDGGPAYVPVGTVGANEEAAERAFEPSG